MLGYVIALSTMAVGGRYVSLFFMAVGYAGELGCRSLSLTSPPGMCWCYSSIGFALTMVWVSNVRRPLIIPDDSTHCSSYTHFSIP